MTITPEIREKLLAITGLVAGALATNGGSSRRIAEDAGAIAIAIYHDARFQVGEELPAPEPEVEGSPA